MALKWLDNETRQKGEIYSHFWKGSIRRRFCNDVEVILKLISHAPMSKLRRTNLVFLFFLYLFFVIWFLRFAI